MTLKLFKLQAGILLIYFFLSGCSKPIKLKEKPSVLKEHSTTTDASTWNEKQDTLKAENEKIYPNDTLNPTSRRHGGGGNGFSRFIVSLGEFRTFNGSGNNPNNLGMGAEGTEQNTSSAIFIPTIMQTAGLEALINPTMVSAIRRMMPAHYMPDGDTPNTSGLPHPRLVSNTIFAQDTSIPSPAHLSQIAYIWGQFIDHDMTLAPIGNDDSFSIPPFDDDMTRNGITFFRSEKISDTGLDEENPRMQFNFITSFIDGSQIYGSSDLRADWLRSYSLGELKTSLGDFLPFGEADGSSPPMAGLVENPDLSSPADLYVAGDTRANEILGLLSMHTLFMREHNRLAREIRSRSGINNDEIVFQSARKIVGALIQAISYNEFLPALGINLPAYEGYQESADPRITNLFSAAGFRLGHTMVADTIPLKNKQGETTQLALFDAFFKPSLLNENTLADLFRGAASSYSERIDNKIVDGIRNFLFGPPGTNRGLDLAMINIQRSRDHGLPDYIQTRAMFNGGSEIPPEYRDLLLTIYPSLEDVDLWVAMLGEPELEGKAVGQTIYDILSMQFKALRDGDRFFYLNDRDFQREHSLGLLGYTHSYINNRSLAKIISDNLNVAPSEIQNNVFIVPQEVKN
ncbi:MAG: peroxidase family protein [Myxococcales bacterium]|nr:MAG: peroxidase family protein [Myxococcales bacterium]